MGAPSYGNLYWKVAFPPTCSDASLRAVNLTNVISVPNSKLHLIEGVFEKEPNQWLYDAFTGEGNFHFCKIQSQIILIFAKKMQCLSIVCGFGLELKHCDSTILTKKLIHIWCKWKVTQEVLTSIWVSTNSISYWKEYWIQTSNWKFCSIKFIANLYTYISFFIFFEVLDHQCFD